MLQRNNISYAELDTRRSFLIVGVGVVVADVLGEEDPEVVFSTNIYTTSVPTLCLCLHALWAMISFCLSTVLPHLENAIRISENQF